MAHRRVLAVVHEPARVLRGVDVGEHDAHGARVEESRGEVVLVAGHADERRHARVVAGHGDLGGHVDAHRVVLHVDEGEVVAARGEHAPDVHRARLPESEAERELPRGQPFFHRVP